MNNDPKTEQMLLIVQTTASQYRTTDITNVLGLRLDRNLIFKNHVNQLKAPKIFTWKNFKCIPNQAFKPSYGL